MATRRRWALCVLLLLVGCGAPAKHTTAVGRTTTTTAASVAAAASTPTTAPPTTAHSTPAPSTASAPRTDLPPLPADARVRVAMAPVWHTPTSPRPMDRLALGVPIDIRGWLAPMTTKQREDLTDRVDTQALLDDRVIVIGAQGDWAHVLIPDQPNPADARGYPGWVPLAQLTFAALPTSPTNTDATVTALTTWLLDAADGHRVMEIGMGTRLPVRALTADAVDVAMLDGTVRRLARADVSVTPRGAPALPATADDIVRVARLFTGLPYLWGGVSGFGVDCSGLTWIDYRLHGITIPRDASHQAASGTPVATDALRPGDIVFFASKGVVHHNGLVVGDNLMLHASHTGTPVREVRLDQPPYAGQIAAARRYLPGTHP
ncbi:MAG: C40 family peptidase [Actinobacteria bacterium]|nr:C40 family peptidase [Actinomycetota bacterium]MBV9933425.1 C40 family peptidase [Actinomycetota bacterium]